MAGNPRPRTAAALLWVLGLLVVTILVQVFLAGAGVLAGEASYLAVHRGVGHFIELVALAVLVLGFVARDRRAGILGIVLFLLSGAQNGLIAAPGLVRAFHVVGAFLIFGIALVMLQARLPRRTL